MLIGRLNLFRRLVHVRYFRALLISSLVLATWQAAHAGNADYEVNFYVKQGVSAKVLLSEARLLVQVNNGQQVPVSFIHFPLLREWGGAYLQIGDYDHDGMNDVAVLKSAGQFGQKRCYAVYRYNPATGRFRSRKSFDRCGL